MKKIRLSVLLALLAWVGVAYAGPVTAEQALVEARQFMVERVSSSASIHRAPAQMSLTTAGDAAYYYVFNIGDGGGFVIVSGDDRTNPILGYSDSGSFDEKKIPANMKSWLEGYGKQIALLDKMESTQLAKALAAPRKASVVDTRNSIAPLISTKWDQATPYWNKCPQFMDIDENGDTVAELAYTGCVATSMSQVMNYHKWPPQTTKVIPSYPVTYYISFGEYGQFDTDALPVQAFDWEHMRDTYTGAEEQVYTDAVATLMLYAGCAAEMQYGLTASGTSDPKVPTAFHEYFDYDATLAYRSDYDQTAWEELIYQELLAGRPMIYNGRAGSGGGHSFVCDGYEYGDYYHINWGWGGMGNGYFVLSILNPNASGIGGSSSSEGYNIDQTAIIGIKPGYSGSQGGDEVDHRLTVYNMYPYSTTVDRSDDGNFYLTKRKYVRVTWEDHFNDGTKYKSGIALFDMDDNFVQLIASRSFYSSSLTSTDTWPESNDSYTKYAFGKGITSGTYKIVPVSQESNSTEWKQMYESDRYYIEATFSQYSVSFTQHPLNDLTATNFVFSGGEKVGCSEQCTVTVRNNSVDRFSGRLYFYLTNEQIDEYGEYLTVVEAEVPAGGQKDVTFNFTCQNAGTKTAQLSLYESSYGGSKLPGTGTVTIAAAEAEQEMDLGVVISADGAIDGKVYNSSVRFRADITNYGAGEYNKYVLAPLFIVEQDDQGNRSAAMVTYKRSNLNLQPGETKTLYFDFDNLAYGSTYSLNIYARNESDELENLVAGGQSILYEIARGLVTWDGTDMTGTGVAASGQVTIPDNALAARLEGLAITGVTPNSNPNTIYFIGENESVPAGLEGRNVVKGNTAASIVLTEGYGYFIPQSFTAQSITYSRPVDRTRDAGQQGGWNTMVLPFAPTSVAADGAAIDWFRSSDDTGKALWVCPFKQEVDGKVVFDYADTVKANVPYIISQAASLAGKTVTWSASEVLLKPEPIAYTSGQNYLMDGVFVDGNDGGYFLNAAGDKFVNTGSDQRVNAFRAYFRAMQAVDDDGIIPIDFDAEGGSTVLVGDVNLDGVVDVADLNIIADIILGTRDAADYDGRANLNGDDTVSVADLNLLATIILNQ